MSLDASTLQVIVKGDGITSTTDALNKLAQAGDKAEKSSARLARANNGADKAASASAKVWYDLVDKVSKAKEREFNALQRHNNRVYGLAQAEANRMNKQMDRITQQDAANFAKRRAAEQKQLEDLDTLRHKAAAKEYARQQAEGNRLNALLDRQRKQQEAAAKASAERQRVQNATYSASSVAQQIATLQRAQAYANQGGNVSQRYGSNVAGALGSGELSRLTQQYRQLQSEARRANSTMADTHAAVRGLSGSLGALWMTYGNLLPLIAGAAVGAAIKGVIDVGADIEHTLEKIRVLGGATTAEVDKMRVMILDLGKGAQGPRDVAEAFSVLTLAGLKANEAMVGVGAALNLAIAGDVSIEKAASTLVQVSTSLGYTAADFNHVADVVAKTAAVSMSSVDSISGAFLSAAAVGEVYGASLQDIGLGLATVANLGIQATAAGTTLKNFYADLAKGTEKSTKTLKAMGLSLRDLKDENGGFIDLIDLVYKLEEGFKKLNPQARAEAMDKLFGERGIKTGAALIAQLNKASTEVDALGNKYASKLDEIADEINKSAAFSSLAAIAMQQTTNNQLKSVANTLQTVLGQAFASVAPQIGLVARELKATFNSPEFAAGLKTIIVGVADLTKTIVTNLDWIVKLAAAYAAFKVTMFAAGLIQIARGFTLASIGAKAFTMSLGPIGIAIAGLTTLWTLYESTKNKALDNKAASGNLNEQIENLRKNTAAEQEAAALRAQGQSEIDIARKKQLDQDKEASAAAIKASEDGVAAQKKALDEQYKNLSENQKRTVELVKKNQYSSFVAPGYAVTNFIKNEKAFNDSLREHKTLSAEVRKETEAFVKARQANNRAADEAAKKNQIKPTGDGELGGGDAEKAAQKAVKFHANEALELNKLIGTYEAKNAAMRQSIELGKHVAAEAQQAIVLENLLAGKYGSKSKDNALYQSQMRLAMAADEAKAENERLKKVNEFATKLAELEAAQKAYNAEAVEGSMTHFGALRKEAEGLIAVTSMSDQAAESLRKRADAADAYKKSQEAIVKLNSAADSSRNRAEEAKEEAEMMRKYGENTKLGAMAVAELVIQKSKLDDVTGNVAKSALREAAATEQLNTAYRDLVKQQIDLSKAVEDAQAESKLIFANSEAEKVKIANETRKKLLDIEYQKALDAYNVKEKMGKATPEDFTAFSNAYNTYIESTNKADQLASIETNNLKLKDWKKTIDDIEQIGREGFYNLTEKGVGLWKGMANTFKSMFKTTVMDYIYKEFAKPFVLKVVASLAGFVGADSLEKAANAMGGDGGSSITSTVTKLYDVFKSGGSMEKSIANGAQSLFDKIGIGGPSGGAPGQAAQWTGQIGGTIAGYAAGTALNSAISGKYETGSGFMKAEKVATAVASAVAGPVGGAVGGAISGLINRAFGRGPKETTSQGIRGSITSDGTTGESYNNWMQKGGWFRSDKKGTDVDKLNEDIINSFTSGLNEMKASSYDFAKNLGINSTALQGYTKAFDIKLTDDAEANQKAISDFFVSIGDDMATKLVPNIMEFAKQGETAATVLERLSTTFAATSNLADILGKSVTQLFGSDGLESANARTKLVDLSGGADTLNSKAAAYVDSIYTDAEKLAPVQKALAEAMKELGVSSITTKAEFKAYVETLNLTDESQIKLFNNLLELAPAFAQVADAAEEAAKVAADAAKEAAEKLAEANKLAMEKAFDFAENAFDRLSTAIDAEKDNIDAKYDSVIDKINQTAEASVEAAEKQREAAEKQRDAVKSILDSLNAALQSTVVESAELTRARRMEAQSYLAVSAIQARAGGSVANMQGLDKALETIAKPSEDLYSSFEEYARDQAWANHNISALAGTAQTELTAAELTIERLNATIDAIEKAAEDQIAVLEKNREEEKSYLDNVLSKAQEQLDALKGIDNSVMGVVQALNNFAASMASVRATELQQTQGNGAAVDSLYKDLLGRGADASGKNFWEGALNSGYSVVDITKGIKGSSEYQDKSINDLYKNILGRDADASGFDFWRQALKDGHSLASIEAQFRSSPEYLNKMGIPSYDVGTDYVPNDGLAMIHKGEMIIPAEDAAQIRRQRSDDSTNTMSDEVVRVLQEIKQVIMSGDVANAQQTSEVKRILKKWDGEGLPTERQIEEGV